MRHINEVLEVVTGTDYDGLSDFFYSAKEETSCSYAGGDYVRTELTDLIGSVLLNDILKRSDSVSDLEEYLKQVGINVEYLSH